MRQVIQEVSNFPFEVGEFVMAGDPIYCKYVDGTKYIKSLRYDCYVTEKFDSREDFHGEPGTRYEFTEAKPY